MVTIFVRVAAFAGALAFPMWSAAATEHTLESAPQVVYSLPKDLTIVDAERSPTNGIRFIDTFRVGAGRLPEARGIEYKFQNGMLIVTEKNGQHGGSGKFQGAYHEYQVKLAREIKADKVLVTLKPVKEITQDSFLGLYQTPPFPMEDLEEKLKEGRLGIIIEVDSPYPVDAVVGNFRRLLKEKHFRPPIRFAGKQFTSLYELPREDGVGGEVFLEAYPYRTGSKAIAYIDLSLHRTAWTRPTDQAITSAVTKIKKIITD